MSNRRDRRKNDPAVQRRREQLAAGKPSFSIPVTPANGVQGQQPGNIIGFPPLTGPLQGSDSSGGYGMPEVINKPASGSQPKQNPFIIPKSTGLNIVSQSFPNQYYVDWSPEMWRMACNQCTQQGWPISIAAMYVWCFQRSPFVQSLFKTWGRSLDQIPFFCMDKKGNPYDDWTKELCGKFWHKGLRREILFSLFWGFSGLNIDFVKGKVYKYPMQQLDNINRMLRTSTFDLGNGMSFDQTPNLLWVQSSSNDEDMLGMMQVIAVSFIEMNMFDNNWLQAGRRLAFPILKFGYPQDDTVIDPTTNQEVNSMRDQATLMAQNVDPSQAMVIPYIRNKTTGEIESSLQVDFEATKSGNNMYKMYSDFDAMRKEEIMQLVYGGILTATTGKNGNRSLGEVHEKKFDAVMMSAAEFVESVLNGDYLAKLKQVYNNIPDDLTFNYDRSKKWTLEEIEQLSNVLFQSGMQFTPDFFEEYGLSPDFIQPAPPAGANAKPIPVTQGAKVNYYMGANGEKKKYLR